MFLDVVYKEWKKIACAAIVLLCLAWLLMFSCRSRQQVSSSVTQTTPPKPEHETFRGVDVAPRQILIKISSCEGVESRQLVDKVTEFSRQITDDSGTVASRATNSCWFLIESPTLPVQRLMDRFNEAIAKKRTLIMDNVNATVVHAEPNFHFQITPPVEGQPLETYSAPPPPPPAATSSPAATLSPAATPPPPAATPSPAATPASSPDDDLFLLTWLWGLKNPENPGIDTHAEAAWGLSTGDRGIVVGVIDTGIYYEHPDLLANVWSAPRDFDVTVGGTAIHCPKGSHGFNAVALTPSEICDPLDPTTNTGHGTHVAGIIGAVGNNSEGVVGVNWETTLLGLKTIGAFGTATGLNVSRAIEFAVQLHEELGADANVRVLNASFGYLTTASDPGVDSLLLREAIELAGSKNMLFVASAGENNGNDNDVIPHYPSNYPLSNLVSVTAINSTGALATIGGSLSNHGKNSVHLAAPGKGIYSTYPVNLGYEYYRNSGTSMATPFVSGAAALMLSVPACSTLNAADLKRLIMEGTDPTPSLSETASGGRLNVFRSIELCTTGGP
ncbi:MAG: S8 family serine peptidase [Pyrinomonadaceae bacterium]|nr:S8 family serine peptidase [Pyrinomonadaceae bacterium]